jgi:O-Antigen ligase/PDZ domain
LKWMAYASLLLLAASLPFSIKGAVLFFRLAALFWLAFLLVRLFRRERISFRPSLLQYPMLAFLLLTSLSTIFSYEPLLSWGRMRTVSLLFVAVLVSQIPKNYREAKTLVGVLLFAIAVNLGHTAWQYTYGTGVELANLSATGPLAKAGLIRGDVVQAIGGKEVRSSRQLLRELTQGSPSDLLEMQIARGAPTERWTLRVERGALNELSPRGATAWGRPVRAQGFFRHYIPYAEFLLLCGTLIFGFAVAYRHHPQWTKVGFAVLFGAVLIALIFTATRAALAALLVGCFAALWTRAGKNPRLVGIGVAVAVLLGAFLWFQHVRGSWESQEAGTRYRALMWSDGIRLAKENPWLGVGMDSVHNHWNEWGIRAYQQYPNLKSHFHSSYVQLAAECGLPALAAWLWLLGTYFWTTYKMCRQRVADPFLDAIALAGFGTAIAFATLCVLHYALGDSEAMILFWFIVGITWWFYAYRVGSLDREAGLPAGS